MFYVSERHRLFTDLLSDYGDIAAVGPRSHHEEAVNITIGFYLYEVVDIVSTEGRCSSCLRIIIINRIYNSIFVTVFKLL